MNLIRFSIYISKGIFESEFQILELSKYSYGRNCGRFCTHMELMKGNDFGWTLTFITLDFKI